MLEKHELPFALRRCTRETSKSLFLKLKPKQVSSYDPYHFSLEEKRAKYPHKFYSSLKAADST